MMAELSKKVVLCIHPFTEEEMEDLQDKFLTKNVKFRCYNEDSFDPNEVQQREIQIVQADLVVILLTADLSHDPVTRATLIIAIDHYQSREKPTVAVTTTNSRWEPTLQDMFIRPDNFNLKNFERREDLFTDDFVNYIRSACDDPKAFIHPPREVKGYGTAWNFALGFLFKVAEDDHGRPAFLPKLLDCEWLKKNPDKKDKISHKIYVVIPVKDAKILKSCAVDDGLIKVKSVHANQDRTYDLYLHRFKNCDGEEKYAIASVTRTLEPFVERYTEEDFHLIRMNFWAELSRILCSGYSDHIRDHIELIFLPDHAGECSDQTPDFRTKLQACIFNMISQEIQPRQERV